MKKIFILVCSCALLAACNNSAKTNKSAGADSTSIEVTDIHNAENSLDYEGTYKGVFPAADCPGIETTLTLNPDKTFSLHSVYIDRDSSFDEKGTYTLKDNLLTLNEEGGELSYYKEIEEIDVVEPDEVFVEVCKKFFPDNARGLDDPRVRVFYADGLRFLRSKNDQYDLIINDAIDPLGHTAGLFTKEFYGNCYRALKEDGIMVYQHGSPFYDEDEDTCRAMHRKASHSFPISRVYQAHIPTCASGYWLFGFTSKKYHPLTDLNVERWKERNIKTWYYTTNLHKGAFMLPRYVEDMLEEEEGRKK